MLYEVITNMEATRTGRWSANQTATIHLLLAGIPQMLLYGVCDLAWIERFSQQLQSTCRHALGKNTVNRIARGNYHPGIWIDLSQFLEGEPTVHFLHRITSYNVCYTKLLRFVLAWGYSKLRTRRLVLNSKQEIKLA